MASADGSLIFDTEIDTLGFKRDTNTIKGQANGLKSTFMSLGKTIAIAFGVTQLIKFGKQAIDTASDLQEVQNVVDTAFGEMTYKMEQFADSSIESFGISKLAAKQTGSVFMAMARGMGIAMDSASDMSISLTGLSADIASFYNIEQSVASTALKSIFTGETETLKQFGIVMTEVNLQSFAFEQGINKRISAMSQSEKVQLRYNYVMQQTALAQGDFARTSTSWANQTRVLSERWKEFLGILGTGLINVLTPVIKFLNIAMSQLISFATTAGKILSTFFNIKSAASGATNTIADIGTSAKDASSGIQAMGDSAEKASKKAKKSTAGIDELNVLTENVADNAEGASDALGDMGGGGGSYGMDITPVVNEAETSKFEKSISELADIIKKQAKVAADSFMEGFKEGIGEINIEDIATHIRGIGTSLKDIFTDPGVQQAAQQWVITTANSLGKITGSMASIGLTVAELFYGSIDTYLSQNKGFIKEKVIEMFDLSAESSQIQADLAVVLADIFTVFRGEDSKQIGADLISIFANSFLSLLTLGMKFGNDLMTMIAKPITDNKEKIKTALENTISPISTIVEGVKKLLEDAFKSVEEMYNEYLKPSFDNMAEAFSVIFAGILDGYNEYLAPTIDRISERFSTLVNKYINPMIDNIVKLFGSFVTAISELWVYLSPFIAWLIKDVFAVISEVLSVLWTVFELVISNITNAVTLVLGVFRGLLDFIVGVFTGDWNKAWGGIKTIFVSIFDFIKKTVSTFVTFFTNIFLVLFNKLKNDVKLGMDAVATLFGSAWKKIKQVFVPAGSVFKAIWNEIKKPFNSVATWFESVFSKAWEKVKKVFSSGGKVFDGIKDGIANVFKTVVNKLISGINRVISIPFDKINSMLNSIRDVSVGPVKPFSGLWGHNPISTPSIPKLATGTVVPANYGEFAAILGDNKRETEIVSPLSTMKQALKEALKESGMDSNGNINLTVNLEGQPVYQTVVKYNKRNTLITGRNALAT